MTITISVHNPCKIPRAIKINLVEIKKKIYFLIKLGMQINLNEENSDNLRSKPC